MESVFFRKEEVQEAEVDGWEEEEEGQGEEGTAWAEELEQVSVSSSEALL